jgi:hypothetical protein
LVTRVFRGLQDSEEVMEHLELLEILDWLVTRDCQELLEPLASQDPLVLRELRVCKEQLELGVQLGPQDQPDLQEVQVQLV